MFLIDDVAAAPFRGLLWVFKEIANAVDRARDDQADALTAELQELYRRLERGEIDEATFDEREEELLEALERLDADETDAP